MDELYPIDVSRTYGWRDLMECGDPSEGPAIRLNRGAVDGAQSLSRCHGNRLASIQYR
jgi:hypothetical protein